jgi:hypothetical protein
MEPLAVPQTSEQTPSPSNEPRLERIVPPPPRHDPLPEEYGFAPSALTSAEEALNNGDYRGVRQILRDSQARLSKLIQGYPRSTVLRDLQQSTADLMRRAATACQAERAAEQQRGGTPPECD